MKRYPLLQSQMGVFAECIKNPDSAGYNLPYTCKLPDDTDMQRLKAAWEKLIARHRVVRTRFGFSDTGEVYQYSDSGMQIPVVLRLDRDDNLQEYLRSGFMRAFDLMSGEDHATNRKIIHAFCPKMDYRNTFLQNVTILDWMVQE